MKYQQITIDGKKMVRQMPIWDKPSVSNGSSSSLGWILRKCQEWDEEFKSKPTFLSELNLPDGTIVEEGKDFEWRIKYEKVGYGDLDVHDKKIAIHLPSKQDGIDARIKVEKERQQQEVNEDELWEEVYKDLISHYSGITLHEAGMIKWLSQHYHITKRNK